MNEFSVLCEYCNGQKFYYYYSPSDSILEGTFGAYDYRMDGVDWIPRATKEAAKIDRFNYLQAKKMKDNQKIEWHPLLAQFEMLAMITDILKRDYSEAIKPKSEFDILNEEQKNIFDSDLKAKIKQMIFTKENAIATLKKRIDDNIGTDYHISKDYLAISENMDKIRLLRDILK